MIEAFGNFVVGGNYIIGAVIFLVLIAIQYVVINHGAVRISEVTARFTLDALPGKQMSIDSRSERRPDRRNRGRGAASNWRPKPNSTAPWTARRDSRSATPWPAF